MSIKKYVFNRTIFDEDGLIPGSLIFKLCTIRIFFPNNQMDRERERKGTPRRMSLAKFRKQNGNGNAK